MQIHKEDNMETEYKYDDFIKAAIDTGMKFHWQVAAYETGFYAFTSVPCRVFGDSEGFFTYAEIQRIGEEFSKADNPSIERHPREIREFTLAILSKALTEERFNEYKKLL